MDHRARTETRGAVMAKKKASKKSSRRRVIFRLEEPSAENVILMGDFNSWDAKKHAMKRDEQGIWSKIVMLVPGRYEYKFLVDGDWRNDPANEHQAPNRFGTTNNVIDVLKS
jgi:1,4-alpha-glucan branching enzyme